MRWDGRQNVAFAPCVQLFTATVAVAVVRQFVMIWGISFERARGRGKGEEEDPRFSFLPSFLPSVLPSLELLLLRLLRENLICSIDKRGKRGRHVAEEGVRRGEEKEMMMMV